MCLVIIAVMTILQYIKCSLNIVFGITGFVLIINPGLEVHLVIVNVVTAG